MNKFYLVTALVGVAVIAGLGVVFYKRAKGHLINHRGQFDDARLSDAHADSVYTQSNVVKPVKQSLAGIIAGGGVLAGYPPIKRGCRC